MQSTVEAALSTVVGTPVSVLGSGRTDAGAHALHQVIAFSAATPLSTDDLGRAANFHLPRDIAMTAIREVPAVFNPRRDATSRTYRYHIWNRPVRSPFLQQRAAHVSRHLDESSMHSAAQVLLGTHDLSAFIPVRTQGSRERTIFDARCWREGSMVLVQLEAGGFMRQMARSIVGTLIRVGRGKLPEAEFADVLRAGKREFAGETAPAEGLYLVHVNYPGFTVDVEEPFLPVGPHTTADTVETPEEIL